MSRSPAWSDAVTVWAIAVPPKRVEVDSEHQRELRGATAVHEGIPRCHGAGGAGGGRGRTNAAPLV